MSDAIVSPGDDQSVPVRLLDAFGGIAECHGSLRVTAEGLRLEFQSRDGLLNLFKSGVKEAVVPWTEVVDLALKRNWLVTRLLLTVRSLKPLEGVPGTNGAQVRMGVDRRHRTLARQVAFAVNLRLCERELRQATSHPLR